MSDKVYSQVLSDFIEVAASKSHTPGGGNVSAVVATLAASMVAMVGNLTVSNKKYAEYHEQAPGPGGPHHGLHRKAEGTDQQGHRGVRRLHELLPHAQGDRRGQKGPGRSHPGGRQKRHPGAAGNLQDLPGRVEGSRRAFQIRQQEWPFPTWAWAPTWPKPRSGPAC